MTDCSVAGAAWTAKDYVLVVMSLAILTSIIFAQISGYWRRGPSKVWDTKMLTYGKVAQLLTEMQRHFQWASVHDETMKRSPNDEASRGKSDHLNHLFFAYAKLHELLDEDRLICSNRLYKLAQTWHGKVFAAEADRFSLDGADAISLDALKANLTKFAQAMLKVCKTELGITETSRSGAR
jgi:hypothetical protein